MKKFGLVVGAVMALGWGTAFAANPASAKDEPAQTPSDAVDDMKESLRIDTSAEPEFQVGISAGVNAFTGALGDTSRTGPSLGVTVGSDIWNFLGMEVGYEGSRNGISDPRVPSDQSIWRHNVSALAKAGPKLDNGLRPFVGAGLGASYVNITDGADGAFYRPDFMGEVPLAAGVDLGQGNLHAGIRGSYRFLFADEFQELSPSLDNPPGGLLGAQLTVGGQF